MTGFALVLRSLAYYWPTNLAVIGGVGTAVAVLSGALLVGDSVRGSLRDLALARLGRTTHVINGQSFFRDALASELVAAAKHPTVPLIALEGTVVNDTDERRAGGVAVYGVDDRFWRFHGIASPGALQGRDVFVSDALATELGLQAGEGILVRVAHVQDIPAETLFGRRDDASRAIRLTAKRVLSRAEMGDFSLRPTQGPARAVFLPLARIQRDLERADQVNTILVSAPDVDGAEYSEAALRRTAKLSDLGLRVRDVTPTSTPRSGEAVDATPAKVFAIESAVGLLTDRIVDRVNDVAKRTHLLATPIFTYLANEMRAGGRAVPYSLVTGVDPPTLSGEDAEIGRLLGANTSVQPGAVAPIVLHEWLAGELGAAPGDRLSLDYYLWHTAGTLATRTATFRVAGVVPMEGLAVDRTLAPEYPGITESANVADWDPPFPVDLKRVTRRDEDYWDQYRTAPKAFVPLAVAQSLWQSRYGRVSSVRLRAADRNTSTSPDAIVAALSEAIDPTTTGGLVVTGVREQGLAASRGATNFAEYFTYFSFFLVVAALMLAALFFRLTVEQRARELGLLHAVGFRPAHVTRVLIVEAVAIAALGAVLGVAGAIAYASLILLGLRTWWVGAVGTTALTLHIGVVSLLLGAAGGLVASVVFTAWTSRALSRHSPRALLAGVVEQVAGSARSHGRARRMGIAAVLLAAASAAALTVTFLGLVGETAGFFATGILLLATLLSFTGQRLYRETGRRDRYVPARAIAVARVGAAGVRTRPARTVLSIALVAFACFVIVAVGAFRGVGSQSVDDRTSGTGGYASVGESVAPIVHDPNTPAGRGELGVDVGPDVKISRFRLRPGDDASCLNLYAPRDPRVVGVAASFIQEGRFRFQAVMSDAEASPKSAWHLLDRTFPDGAVPFIADANSAAYVLHVAPGEDFVVGAEGTEPIRMRLVATLSRSIFQSEVLISERQFVRLFPEHIGYRFFLVEARDPVAATRALEGGLRDYGFDATSTIERLAAYHRVEDTYLATFQMLGGLGLLLGTFGLGAVLLRNVLERRRELALLRAVGYNRMHLAVLVVAENVVLLTAGLAFGTMAAVVAIAPALSTRSSGAPPLPLGLLLAILAAGLGSSLLATAAAVRTPLIPALKAE